MTSQKREGDTVAGSLSDAANKARAAIGDAKDYVANTDFDALRGKAADAASAAYQSGREMLGGNEQIAKATDEFAASIRRNPLAAVGIAFTAGIVLALLTRG